MARLKQLHPNDVKSQLANDTCTIYLKSHSSCIHYHSHQTSTIINNLNFQPSFVDWYLILRVAEDASLVTIRKQYHKLALLLHPDKNKHPKAELAFKLILQAYECLSDDAKRISFNLERLKNQCTQCSRIPHNSHPTHNANTGTRNTSNSARNSRFYKVQQNIKAIREHLMQEARVIERCIRFNQRSNDYPVFDPSSYTHSGYPHRRIHHHKIGASFWDVQRRNVVPNLDQRRGRCESPIFELKTDCSSLNINSACVGS